MHKDLYKNKKKEAIILSNLSNLDKCIFSEYCYRRKKRYKEEEIKKREEKFKNVCLDFYDIDNEKSKELESIFKQLKLKVYFKGEPKTLKDGKFYTI